MTIVRQQFQYSGNNMDIAEYIYAMGQIRSVRVWGWKGTGKSSTVSMLDEVCEDHLACYVDCSNLDVGDLQLPFLIREGEHGNEICFTRFAPNEALGIHLDRPLIIMLDEFDKANDAVQQALARVLHKDSDGYRHLGTNRIHPDSFAFLTANMDAEGVGRVSKTHITDRVIDVYMRSPTADEWVAWGLNNGMHSTVLSWVRDEPKCLHTADMVADPSENEYIWIPGEPRVNATNPRSLHTASDILHRAEMFADHMLMNGLIGTVGTAAAAKIHAYHKIGSQLPSEDVILNEPLTAPVPDSAAAQIMLVDRALSNMDRKAITPWMNYMARLDENAAVIFNRQATQPGYHAQTIVMQNGEYTKWFRNNMHLFAADQV